MKLENQVVNLELSKRLKELGVKQESFFKWYGFPDGNGSPDETRAYKIVHDFVNGDIGICSAFTVAELGEMLPVRYTSWNNIKDSKVWWCGKKPISGEDEQLGTGATEADTRAKMLIYLIENQIIKL